MLFYGKSVCTMQSSFSSSQIPQNTLKGHYVSTFHVPAIDEYASWIRGLMDYVILAKDLASENCV